ncbi:MAG: CarD family transcriptional regulator [Anaerolineae bacterium]
MFEVGDKVVHPAHGAGIVAGIEDKALVAEFTHYYVIQLAATDMKLMIPVQTASEIGLRPVARPAQVERIYATLQSAARDLINDFKKRQSILTEQLKSGDILDVAEVVRDLFWRNEESPLSPTESRQLESARQQLASELSLAEDIAVEESLAKIDMFLQRSVAMQQQAPANPAAIDLVEPGSVGQAAAGD